MKQKQSKPAAYFDVPAMNTTAIASQFKQVCEEVADAIREQKGSTDKILPKDFSSEIRSISGGGSVKEYYYRLKTPTVIKDNFELQLLLACVASGSTFILKRDRSINILNDGPSSITGTTYPTVAIMFYDLPLYLPANRGNYEYCAKIVGDWANRLIVLSSSLGTGVTYDDAVAQINQYFEPITEEEFFNLVDIEIE